MSNSAFSYQDLLQIVDLVKTSAQFNEFHLKVGDIELDIRRGEPAARPAPTAPATIALAATAPTSATSATVAPPPAAVAEPHRSVALAYPAGSVLVKSPMVGTFYRSPEPGAHPFVEVGARVTAESIVGIVEVMKLMNSIPAGKAGVVTHLLAGDGEPVQYGQVLVVIEPGDGVSLAAHPATRVGHLRRVLVANRGEIALRVLRACRELGLETVIVHSEADADSLPVRLADRAVCIGPARSNQSYLNAEFIVSAAQIHHADAIHPGYGFLSENADFARLCEMEKIVFVGPRADVIAQMGDKVRARQLAAEAGVPTTPGSAGKLRDAAEAAQLAAQIGFPVLLKAAAGGGGRGMRVVREASELADQYADAAREAKAAFGDDAIYVEKYLSNIRHIEIQVLSDGDTVLHLGERDCSIQRRNQKLLEETPSPVLDAAVRARMCAAAVKLCRHVGYTSAGTIKFILDAASGEFYFMEMNTRIQVEHPVTEMVSGIDLVKAQLEIAGGRPLAIAQDAIRFDGHAIECRINAEDSERDFAPCPGEITRYHAPGGPGIRVDSHIHAGYTVPPYYDSLLAKVVAWGRDRSEAIARMRRALNEMEVGGIKTTIPFHLGLLQHEAFVAGDVHTRFVENELLGARA